MFIQAAFIYDLFTVSSVWSLIAVEAALQHRLGNNEATFGQLVGQAEREGLLGENEIEHLRTGSKLRNQIVHRNPHAASTPGMAQEIIASSHLTVARL